MMEFGTWLSLLILGPGAAGIFIWFLADLRKIQRGPGED